MHGALSCVCGAACIEPNPMAVHRTGCNGDNSVVVEWALLAVVLLNQGTAEEQVNIVLALWQEVPRVKNFHGKTFEVLTSANSGLKNAR